MPLPTTFGQSAARAFGWGLVGVDPNAFNAVIVGGGGGGAGVRGGGGGGGGVIVLANQSISRGSNLTITIGGSGANGTLS